MKRNLKLSQIKLDQKNPRFATRKNKEQNIANFMLKHTSLSQINEMVIDIAKNGLSPLDVIGVFKEKDDFIALDGNRRVLALKILFENENMNLDKKTIEVLGEYKKLADANVKKEEIEVFVFKNRDDVKKWLERKHTNDFGGASHKDWPTFERKIFQNDKLALFISENASEANISYDDYAIKVKYTIWERFFTSEFSREWLGVSYDKESKEFTRENKNKLFERMIAITNATKDKFLNFQSVNKKKDKSKTIRHINKNYLSDSPFESKILEKKPKTRKKATIKNIEFLREIIKNEKLLKVIEQINKINLNNYKELVNLSIRPMIEITSWEFLKNNLKKSNDWMNRNSLSKWIIQTIEEIKKSGFKPRNKSIMQFIENNVEKILQANNSDIHDVQFVSTTIELEENIKRVTIFLEEVWRKYEEK